MRFTVLNFITHPLHFLHSYAQPGYQGGSHEHTFEVEVGKAASLWCTLCFRLAASFQFIYQHVSCRL